jgi:hypothetical protein
LLIAFKRNAQLKGPVRVREKGAVIFHLSLSPYLAALPRRCSRASLKRPTEQDEREDATREEVARRTHRRHSCRCRVGVGHWWRLPPPNCLQQRLWPTHSQKPACRRRHCRKGLCPPPSTKLALLIHCL